VQENTWAKETKIEFKPQTFKMLADVKESYFKNMTIKVPLTEVTEELINDIDAFTESKNGNVQLRFNVFDPETKMNVQLFSRNKKVELDDNLIDYLDNRGDIEYAVTA